MRARRHRRFLLVEISVFSSLLFVSALPLGAQAPVSVERSPTATPAPPSDIVVEDRPNDAGGGLIITWEYPEQAPLPEMFVIFRSTRDGPFERVKETRSVLLKKFEDTGLEDKVEYRYRIDAVIGASRAASEPSAPMSSSAQWFRMDRLAVLVFAAVFLGLVVAYILAARRGIELYIRRIAGLSAVDEAIGRATEMGKPVLFVPGLGLIDTVSTVAALNLLGEVAKKTIEYRIPLICPNRDPVVYTVAREIVRESYVTAGQPDAFDPDSVFFITQQQFAYAAAVDGIMVRDMPATNFFFGYYYAESLILAETGAATGAIQIAGTDAIAQLPFFITACDYTLIGEELYAASAYLSREPVLMGTLKAQDYGKLILMILLVLGSLAAIIFNVDVASFFGGAD